MMQAKVFVPWLLTVAVAMHTVGCSHISPIMSHERAEVASARLLGCQDSLVRSQDASDYALVLSSICVAQKKKNGEHARFAITENEAFRRVNLRNRHELSRVILAISVASEVIDSRKMPNEDPGSGMGTAYATKDDLKIGIAYAIAQTVSINAIPTLTKSLPQGAELGDLLRDAFLWANGTLLNWVKRMDDRVRALAVNQVSSEISRSVATVSQYESLLEQADHLDVQGLSPEATAASLESIRSELILKCGKKEECASHPAYIDLSLRILTQQIAQNKVEFACAESVNMQRPELLAATFQGRVTSMLFDASRGEVRSMSRAVPLAEKVGAAAGVATNVRVDFPNAFEFEMTLPFLAKGVCDRKKVTNIENSVVSRVEKLGSNVRVEFRGHMQEYEEPTSCSRTGRVTRVRSDGTVEYEETCQYRKAMKIEPPLLPILISTNEGASIQPGESVWFFRGSSTLRSAIVVVKDKNGRLVQRRADRIRPEALANRP